MVGYPYGERVAFIQQCLTIGKKYNCKLVGTEWDKFGDLNGWQVVPETVSPTEMMKYYCGAKVVLCINRVSGGYPVTPARGFIEAWSGTPLVIDDKRNIDAYFTDREEVIKFDTVGKFSAIIEMLMNDDKRRVDVGQAGYLRASNYTFAKRLHKMFNLIDAERAGVEII